MKLISPICIGLNPIFLFLNLRYSFPPLVTCPACGSGQEPLLFLRLGFSSPLAPWATLPNFLSTLWVSTVTRVLLLSLWPLLSSLSWQLSIEIILLRLVLQFFLTHVFFTIYALSFLFCLLLSLLINYITIYSYTIQLMEPHVRCFAGNFPKTDSRCQHWCSCRGRQFSEWYIE